MASAAFARPADNRQRQVLDHLRDGDWKSIHQLPVPVREKLLARLIALAWIETRGDTTELEIRITERGYEALTSPA